jgi:TPR repeat protein
VCYGQEIKPTLSELRSLHERADQGDRNAQYNLGVLYDNGEGVTQPKPPGGSAKLLKKATPSTV